jgi:uncharacterized protein
MTREIKLLILLVTDDCNLRCRYCYARGGEKKEYMSWETARKAVDYVAASSKSFKIQFSGGEPLLNFSLVKRVIEYVKMRWGSATFQLQTNGTLINLDLARELKTLRVRPGVSLDGPLDLNDHLRPFVGGEGSTSAVIRGLQFLAAEGIRVGLTTVLTAESVQTLPQLVDWAAYAGNVYGISLDLFRPLGRGVKTDLFIPDLNLLESQVRAALLRADQLVRLGGPRVRFRELERLRYQITRGVVREEYCYATTGQCMAAVPDGSVYPCASLMLLPHFYLGNINEQNFSLAEAVAGKEWIGRKAEMMTGCRDCPDRHLCGGGCLARSYAYTGRVDKPYEGDCTLKKTFMDWVRQDDRVC